jgi:nucleotide-binding universal stress UspA family protein
MEKILLAVDALHPNKKALDFACFLSRLTKSKITGVFLENLVADERPVMERLHSITYPEWELDEHSAEHKEKMALIEKNIAGFKDACICRDVVQHIHRDEGDPVAELVAESRYADLIVLDAETSFNKQYEGTPTSFVKEVLKKAECPVVIAPEKFEGIDEIVFAYNGSASAVFAIKQFTYLFPELYNKKATILHVNKEASWEGGDKDQLNEWLREHYRNLYFANLKGEAEDAMLEYLLKRKNTILAMGAYGRNNLSQFFRPSHADRIIKATGFPVFVAHP